MTGKEENMTIQRWKEETFYEMILIWWRLTTRIHYVLLLGWVGTLVGGTDKLGQVSSVMAKPFLLTVIG